MGLTGSNIQQICGFSYCVSIFPCSLTGTQPEVKFSNEEPRTKPVTSGQKSQGQPGTSWSSKSHYKRPGGMELVFLTMADIK